MDYEIRAYIVYYSMEGVTYNKQFDVEESAVSFAREKFKHGYLVRIIKEMQAINWNLHDD